MNKRKSNDYVRSSNVTVSDNYENIYADPTVQYNGAYEEYEDPADYLPRKLPKGVRLT